MLQCGVFGFMTLDTQRYLEGIKFITAGGHATTGVHSICSLCLITYKYINWIDLLKMSGNKTVPM